MEKIKQKKQINFADFKLNPKKENLFDDCYKNDEFKCLENVCQEAQKIQDKTFDNKIRQGRLFVNISQDCSGNSINLVLKNSNLPIKRTQAIKYMAVYTYINYKFQNNQSTDNCYKLGIEKVFSITRLESKEKREKLEQFALDNNLTSKQLSQLVEVLNNTSPILYFVQQFNESVK